MNRLVTKATIAAILGLAGAANAQIVFQVIGDGAVTDVSANGQWAAGFANAGGIFRWSNGTGFEIISSTTSGNGRAGISADGMRVAASIYNDTGDIAGPGLWIEGSGWSYLGPIDGGGVSGEDGSAYGLSDDGATVTGLAWRSDYKARAFSWTEGTGMVNLGSTYDNRSSRGTAINGDGSVIGGFDEADWGGRLPAVWVDGVLTVLEPDGVGEVESVNAPGNIVGGTAGSDLGAAIWAFDGANWNRTDIGYLPGTDEFDHAASINGISADGAIAVGFNRSGFGPFADYNGTIYTESGLVDVETWLTDNNVDFGGIDIRAMTGISDDGNTLVGWGYQNGFNWVSFRIIIGTPCDADFNGDGAVNTLDVLAFLNAWTAGDTSADFNGDGTINTLDVLAFLNAWTAGC